MTADTAKALTAQQQQHTSNSTFSLLPVFLGHTGSLKKLSSPPLKWQHQSVRGFSFICVSGRNLLCIKMVIWEILNHHKEISKPPTFSSPLGTPWQGWHAVLVTTADVRCGFFQLKLQDPFLFPKKLQNFWTEIFDKVLLFPCTQKKLQILT